MLDLLILLLLGGPEIIMKFWRLLFCSKIVCFIIFFSYTTMFVEINGYIQVIFGGFLSPLFVLYLMGSHLYHRGEMVKLCNHDMVKL